MFLQKFAIEGLTRALSQELGVKGIRVNSICPVLIKTPGLISEIENLDGPARDVGIDKFLENFSQTQTALKRLQMLVMLALSFISTI